MKKVLFICNAHAGKSQIKSHVVEIVDLFIKNGYRVEVYVTQCQGDAAQAAKSWGSRVNRILCSGGDGTLNEVVNGLMQLPEEKRPPVAYIPAGTTNDYARSLKLPVRIRKAAEVAAGGVPCRLDVGRVGDRYFNYAFGFGMFTDVSYATPQEIKKVLGHPAYVLEGLRSLAGTKSYRMRVRWGEQSVEGDFLLGMVTNSHSVAGMKGIWGENIRLDDGLFEVTLVREPSTILKWTELPGELLSWGDSGDLVLRFKAENICLEAEEDINWVSDGEFAGTFRKVDIQNIQQAISLIVPEKV